MAPADQPRIAYFPDSFHEVNGVAHTSRNFVAYAERHRLPFLCVRAGRRPQRLETHGSVQTLELARSSLSFPLERDLYFDLLFPRHASLIEKTLLAFKPTVIHMTGPSELGMMAAYFAWKLRVPLAASWHTNVHEYLARRTQRFTGDRVAGGIEAGVLEATSRFYRLAQVLYAPNAQLCALLEGKTQRPCMLMQRGVDAEMFTPAKRTRSSAASSTETSFVLGFVGRLSVEKNVALLPRIDAALRERGVNFSWLIIGHGDEEAMLRRELSAPAEFAGVLRGEQLATAYANMDLLVFPSHTDTFGNVVLEALASGVPAIVTPDGGPATIVQNGVTGCIATDEDFAAAIAATLAETEVFTAMRHAARDYALACTWDAIFDGMIANYPQ